MNTKPLLSILTTTLMTFAVAGVFTTAKAEQKAVMSWDCFAKYEYPEPTVPIVRVHVYEGLETGRIESNGIVNEAHYKQRGINHYWHFGRDLEFEFLIKPGNSGLLYDFTGASTGEKRGPSLRTECRKTQY